jgi:nitrogen fixation/metabolism regulation signal transduction histidine kinase
MTPYYTTKVKGTGLGLPIVLKIIDDHSGEFLVDNKINNGAIISIKLPKIYE